MKFLVVCEVDHFIRQRMILPTTPWYTPILLTVIFTWIMAMSI